MWMTKYISLAAGGGAHGRDGGTAPDTMTAAGELTATRHLFTKQCLPAGEMITVTATGKGIHGTMKEYPTIGLIKTGGHGITIGTGKETNPGMYKVYRQKNIIKSPDLNPDRRNRHVNLKARENMIEEAVKKVHK
jgi:hypothetical protein